MLMVIGDTMLYASTLITTYAVLEGNKIVALISLGLGIGGFFFTKLYAAKTEVLKVGYEISEDESGEQTENLKVTENKSIKP